MKKALLYNPADNILTALEPLESGDAVSVHGERQDLAAACAVPIGHKIARRAIASGEAIVKCGNSIGTAKNDIAAGEYVHVHNIEDSVSSAGLNQPYEYQVEKVTEIADTFLLKDPPKLYGYRRADGRVGFRNHLLVISSVVCANQPLEELKYYDRDIVCIQNPSGCIILPNEVERVRAVILGLARNPNVGAVIFVGLGCESIEAEWFHNQMKDEKPSAFVRMQTEGSADAAFETLKQHVDAMKPILAAQQRVEVGIGDIVLGTKCGGSDWTTTAVSNPAIGFASDIVVRNGGTSFLGETNGLTGGQETLLRRVRSKEIGDRLLSLLEEIYNRTLLAGHRLEEGNPSPGNIAGGITTLKEKALGNVLKSGTAPIEGTLAMGEYPVGRGLYIVDNPGLDPLSLIGLTCSGANILVYSTGRGSPVGTAVAPSIKLTASPQAQETFSAHMDVDLTPVTRGEITLAEGGWMLFEEIVDVANGKQVKAERGRHREFAFPLLMGAL